MNPFYNQDLISVNDLDREKIEMILSLAQQFKTQGCPYDLLKEKVIATCFFEPSTRTHLSFESAIANLGGRNIGFTDTKNISMKKGESFSDSIKVISQYVDAIVLRHPKEGAARLAAEISDVPVINAGDGGNQHPTQALLDLFSIHETQGKIDGLKIAMAGDLKYGRTTHSLAQILKFFKTRLFFVSLETLTMPDDICDQLKKAGIPFSLHQKLNEVIPVADILYMTRLQKERFPTGMEFTNYCLTADNLSAAKENLKVLHPLPRVEEIAMDVDKSPHAYYFEQARNGLYIRQAVLALLLNKEVSL